MTRSTHYIMIDEGRICLLFAGDPQERQNFYQTEMEAAQALADKMRETECGQLLNSSTCFHPEESGMPNFDFERFVSILKRKLLQ